MMDISLKALQVPFLWSYTQTHGIVQPGQLFLLGSNAHCGSESEQPVSQLFISKRNWWRQIGRHCVLVRFGSLIISGRLPHKGHHQRERESGTPFSSPLVRRLQYRKQMLRMVAIIVSWGRKRVQVVMQEGDCPTASLSSMERKHTLLLALQVDIQWTNAEFIYQMEGQYAAANDPLTLLRHPSFQVCLIAHQT